jgi:NAD(P)-dependent dehydrogenase (short-subunit alcohol dehydrogenase family)
MSIEGKVVMVTGAARGIGRAVCIKLASCGAKIAAFDINEEGLKSTIETIKSNKVDAIGLVADVRNLAQVKNKVGDVVRHFGCIDVLHNNAGIVDSGQLIDISEDQWDKIMDINLKGAFFVASQVAKVMKEQKSGRIINQSSQSSKIGEYGNGVYCISKAGISMMTQVLALELAQYNISVCSISPGYTNSELFQHAMKTRAPEMRMTTEQYTASVLESVPMKRAAEPAEIAELVAFLSDESSYYINGSDILITGGKVMH